MPSTTIPARERPRNRGTLFFMGMVLVALLSGCGGPQSRFASHMQRGQAYYAQGNYVKASLEFRNALQISPKDPNAAVMAGRTAEKLGRMRDAAVLYQAVVDNAPDNPEARADLGRLMVLGGAAERGLAIIEPGLAKHPDDAGLLTARAFVLLNQKDPDKAAALADVEHALRIAPASEEAVALRASMYRDAGDFAGGAAFVSRALQRLPNSTDLRQILAKLYRDAGDPGKAEEQLRALVRLKPQEPQFRYQLAQFYSDSHRKDDAQKVLEDAVRDLKSDEARLRLVAFLAAERTPAQADRTLRDFIAQDPKNEDLRLALGALLQRTGPPKPAIDVYEEVVRRDGTGAKALIARDRIAALAVHERRYDDARKLVDEVLAENAHDNDALSLRGEIYLARADLPAAIADFRAVLREQPDASGVSRLLAQAYLANGQPTLAEESLRKALELAPDDKPLLLQLAQLLEQNGRAAQAVAALEAPARAAKDDAVLQDALVRAYLANRDYASAYTAAQALQTLRPDSADGYYLAGLAAQGQNQPDEAQKQLTHALAVQPQTIDALTALSQLEVSRGRADQAVKLLNETFERNKSNAFPLNLLGEVYMEQKDFGRAVSALTHASEVAPQWWPPYRNLGLARESTGDTAAAIAAYQAGIKVAPSVPKLPIELAQLYEKHDRVADAIACYDAWLKQNSPVPSVTRNLALLLVTYRHDTASLDRARDLTAGFASSNDGTLLDTSGWVHVKRQEYAQALPLLERAAERAPESPEIRYHLAIAELNAGQPERARSNLKAALSGSAKFFGIEEARSALAALNNRSG